MEILNKGDYIDGVLMGMETQTLKGEQFTDEEVIKAAEECNNMAELLKRARALSSALRSLFKLSA